MHVQLARRRIDKAFQKVGRFRPSGSAIGVHRVGVGEDALDQDMDRRSRIDAGQHRGAGIGRDVGAEVGEIRPQVRHGRNPHRQELAVGIQRQIGMGDVVAAMVVAEEGFAPVGGPLDRPVQLAGGEQRQDVFRVHEDLHAEAAADIGRQHMELLFRLVEDLGGELGLEAVNALAGDVEHIAVGIVDRGEAGPAFHRRRRDPVVDQIDADHLGGLGEAGLGRLLVALFPLEAEIAGRFLPHLRGVGSE